MSDYYNADLRRAIAEIPSSLYSDLRSVFEERLSSFPSRFCEPSWSSLVRFLSSMAAEGSTEFSPALNPREAYELLPVADDKDAQADIIDRFIAECAYDEWHLNPIRNPPRHDISDINPQDIDAAFSFVLGERDCELIGRIAYDCFSDA